MPLNKKNRQDKLEHIKNETKTVILYEAPHKLINTLKDIQIIRGNNTNIVLAKELTKIHEKFIRGNIKEVISDLDDVKGEFIIIIEANLNASLNNNNDNNLSLDELYKKYELEGFCKKDIIKKIAKEKNVNKNEIYQYFLYK